MSRYQQFEGVDIGNGACAVCLDLCEGFEPPVWIVEVYNAKGSMGDGVTEMQEEPDGLVALDPEGLAEILRQPPNFDKPA